MEAHKGLDRPAAVAAVGCCVERVARSLVRASSCRALLDDSKRAGLIVVEFSPVIELFDRSGPVRVVVSECVPKMNGDIEAGASTERAPLHIADVVAPQVFRLEESLTVDAPEPEMHRVGAALLQDIAKGFHELQRGGVLFRGEFRDEFWLERRIAARVVVRGNVWPVA